MGAEVVYCKICRGSSVLFFKVFSTMLDVTDASPPVTLIMRSRNTLR